MVCCGHKATLYSKHDKIFNYLLTINHKNQIFALHTHSLSMEVFKHFTKDQNVRWVT
jgi:hypothetical protein